MESHVIERKRLKIGMMRGGIRGVYDGRTKKENEREPVLAMGGNSPNRERGQRKC